MSRPWFKVATRIKDDPAMIRLSPETFKVWIFILALACERDADGEVCHRDDLALVLRLPEDATTAAVDELGHRIKVTKGVVSVRDWLQWQTPTRKPEPAEQVAERQRRKRKKRTPPIPPRRKRHRHAPAGRLTPPRPSRKPSPLHSCR